jgi:hypothetical protein
MGWKFVAAVVFVLASYQGAWGQAIFEDRNANGVFDGTDVDVTASVVAGGGHTTTHPVVVAKAVSQGCEGCTISIESSKRITVKANLSSTGKGGAIELQGSEIVVGTKVVLNGVSEVFLRATSLVSIGDTVRLASLGGGPTYGYGNVVVAAAAVDIGTTFKIDSTESVHVQALATNLFIGPKAVITSRRADVGLLAKNDINIQSATSIRGYTGITVYSEAGAVNLGNSKLVSPLLIMLIGDSVDGNFSLLSKPYVIYDNAHPNGLYVTN